MKNSNLVRLRLVGIALILAVVVFAAFLLRSPNNKVDSSATTRDEAQKSSSLEEPQRNALPPVTSSNYDVRFHFRGGTKPSKPAIPVTASKEQPVIIDPISTDERIIYLQGGFWLEKRPNGSWMMHR